MNKMTFSIVSCLLLAVSCVSQAGAPVQDGLVKHLDASSLSLSDNDPVAAWTDLSPVANDAIQSRTSPRPTYKTASLTGFQLSALMGTMTTFLHGIAGHSEITGEPLPQKIAPVIVPGTKTRLI